MLRKVIHERESHGNGRTVAYSKMELGQRAEGVAIAYALSHNIADPLKNVTYRTIVNSTVSKVWGEKLNPKITQSSKEMLFEALERVYRQLDETWQKWLESQNSPQAATN